MISEIKEVPNLVRCPSRNVSWALGWSYHLQLTSHILQWELRR